MRVFIGCIFADAKREGTNVGLLFWLMVRTFWYREEE